MSTQPNGPGAAPGYEARDTSAIWVALAIALLALLVVVAFLVTRSVVRSLDRRGAATQEEPHPMTQFRRPPATALLQAQPTAEYEAYQARQRELATTYGWIDAEQRIVRLPVERAMELLLERGLPVRSGPEEER